MTIIIIIIIINEVLIKVTLNKLIAGALYIVICGWNAEKVQGWQLTSHIFTQTAHVALSPPKLSYVGEGVPDIINCTRVSSKLVQGFWLPEGLRSAILLCLVL